LFVAASVASFIDDLVESGADRDAATTATHDYMRRLLPDGIRTQGHRFRSIQDEGREIGRLWFGPIRESSGDWYLFEIDIDEEEQGHGLGRAALQEVISELDLPTVDRLGLNVFDSNSAAGALYESLGSKAGTDSTGGREMWRELRVPG
jgi:RimJ/RimL family protein N-acetyltransferase